jgi:hypothetical protein
MEVPNMLWKAVQRHRKNDVRTIVQTELFGTVILKCPLRVQLFVEALYGTLGLDILAGTKGPTAYL